MKNKNSVAKKLIATFNYTSKKRTARIVCIIFPLFMVYSCGTTNKVIQINNNRKDLIYSHFVNNDYEKIFNDLIAFPEYREIIEDQLFVESKYENASYETLKSISNLAKIDFKASIYFDSLLTVKGKSIIEAVSNLDLSQIGKYYREHKTEQELLHDALSEVYLSDLDTLGYATLKQLHDAFIDTDLSLSIDPFWSASRSELLKAITDELESCCETEKRMIELIEYSVRKEIEVYIEEGVTSTVGSLSEKIDRGLFKKIFKREAIDNISISSYANQLIEDNLNGEKIKEILSKPLSSFLSSSNKMRSELLSSYPGIELNDPSFYLAASPNGMDSQFGLSTSEVDNIEQIKAMDSLVSVASIALAFTPYAIVAGVFDIIDLSLGVTEDSRINRSLDNLSNELYKDCSIQSNQFITALFSLLRDEIASDYENIRKKIETDL